MVMSIMKLQKNCSECNALLINDTNNGELICSSCGIVVMEQLVYHGPENQKHRHSRKNEKF